MTNLIQCLDCDKKISKNALFCPHCGCPKELQLEFVLKDAIDERKQNKVVSNGWIKKFYSCGNLFKLAHKVNKRLEGRCIYWHPDGKKKSDVTYVNGKKEGAGIIYETENYIATGKFLNDSKHGKWDTKLCGLSGYDIYDHGTLIKSEDWYENGQQCSRSIKVGDVYKDVGWYENGVKRYEYDWNPNNGYHEGLVTKWYENGKLASKGACLTGSKDGPWTYWYENGNIESTGSFKPVPVLGVRFDLPHGSSNFGPRKHPTEYKVGKWTEWDETGIKRSEGKYSQKPSKYFTEKKIGIWHEWDEKGMLWIKEKYLNGRCYSIYEREY